MSMAATALDSPTAAASWSFLSSVIASGGDSDLRVVTPFSWTSEPFKASPEDCVGCGSIVLRPPLGSMVDEKGRKWHMPCRRTVKLKTDITRGPLPSIHKDSLLIIRYLGLLLDNPPIIVLRQLLALLTAPSGGSAPDTPQSEVDIVGSLDALSNFVRMLDVFFALSTEVLSNHKEAVPHDSELQLFPQKIYKLATDVLIHLSTAPLSPLPVSPDLYHKLQRLEQTILLYTIDLVEALQHLEHADEVSPALLALLQRASDMHSSPQDFAVADWEGEGFNGVDGGGGGGGGGKGMSGPDTCVVCRLRVLEECAALNGFRRWHAACLRCKMCGCSAREGDVGSGLNGIGPPSAFNTRAGSPKSLHSPSSSLSHARSFTSLKRGASSRTTSPSRQGTNGSSPNLGSPSSTSLSSSTDALPHPSLALILQHCVPSASPGSAGTNGNGSANANGANGLGAFPHAIPLREPGQRPTPQRSFSLASRMEEDLPTTLSLGGVGKDGSKGTGVRVARDIKHWRYDDGSSRPTPSWPPESESDFGYPSSPSSPHAHNVPGSTPYCPRCTPPASGLAEGFAAVPQTEQYIFLLGVSLQRLYRAWLRRGFLAPLPVVPGAGVGFGGGAGGKRAGLRRRPTLGEVGGKIKRLLSTGGKGKARGGAS